MTHMTGYHHVSLSVTDRDRSTRWYVDVLGFSIDEKIHGTGFRRVRLMRPGMDAFLTLTAHESGSPDSFSELRPGLDHVAFRVPSGADVDAYKRRFEEHGVDHSEIKPTRSGDGAMITLRDPDNIQLEVFAPKR